MTRAKQQLERFSATGNRNRARSVIQLQSIQLRERSATHRRRPRSMVNMSANANAVVHSESDPEDAQSESSAAEEDSEDGDAASSDAEEQSGESDAEEHSDGDVEDGSNAEEQSGESDAEEQSERGDSADEAPERGVEVSESHSRASGVRKSLVCSHCKEEKPLGEFLWCHQCSCLTCGICYIDNHVTPSLHAASKWRGQKVAFSCMSQMKGHLNVMDTDCRFVKSTIDASLEKLKRKLHQSVDEAFARKKVKIAEEILKIDEAFPSAEPDGLPQLIGNSAKIASLFAHVEAVGGFASYNLDSIFKSPAFRDNLPYDDLAKLIFSPQSSPEILNA